MWALGMAMRFPLMGVVGLMHAFTSMFVGYMLAFQTFGITMNLTMNETMNIKRYPHFWRASDGAKDGASYSNPFDKGIIGNWMDFWWYRRRSECGPRCGEDIVALVKDLAEAG